MSVFGAAQWGQLAYEPGGYGTYDVSLTTMMWMRLTAGQAFYPKGAPNPWEIRSADGGNLRQQRGSQRTSYTWKFSTPLYQSQAVFLIGLFSPLVTIGGRKQVQSFSANFWDGVETRQALGCRTRNATITADNGRDYLMLEMDGDFQKWGTPVSPFNEPASTVFPTDRPYVFQDSAGQVTLGGAVTNYKSLSIRIANNLKANFNELAWLAGLDYTGRSVSWTLVREYNAVTDRSRFEGSTAFASSVGFNVTTPAHAMTFNTQGNCFLSAFDVDRSFDDNQYETITIEAFKDPTAGTDLTTTVS